MGDEDDDGAQTSKVVLLGESGVGKTCIIARFINNTFEENLISTTGASYAGKTMTFDEYQGKSIKFEIWDTAGQEKYRSLTKIFIKDAKMALLVYAIDDENSFKDLDMWLNIVKDINNEDITLGIAANKADLYEKAKVTDEQGKKYAEKIGASWSSTSALLDDNGIDGLVDELLEKYLESNMTGGKENRGMTLINKIPEDNEKGGGCCSGKKDKKKNKNKNVKKSEVIENNDKYNEDEF